MNHRVVRGLKALLMVGMLAGFGYEARHARNCAHARHEARERHIAELCVAAAKGATPGGGEASSPPSAKD